MPDVAVAAVEIGFGLPDWNIVRAGICESVFARLNLPLAPRCDDLQLRRDGLVRKLKPNLVIALAGATVSQSIGADAQSNFRLALGQNRPRERSAQQILVLVNRPSSQCRPDISSDELLAQILN